MAKCDILLHMKLTREEYNTRQRERKSTPEFKEKRRKYDRVRLLDPKVQARMKAYRQSPRGKEVSRKSGIKLRATEKYKERARLYKRTDRYQRWRRNHDFKKKFSITLDDYDKMFEAQNGVCAICSEPETFIMKGRTHSLAVDHCHSTGKVRGLLCRQCNQMLGYAKDKIEILNKAIEYLKKYGIY